MRIVFIIPYFYDAWAYGGQPRSAFEMARGLTARGHLVKVLTTDSAGDHRLAPPDAHSVKQVEGIEIHRYRNVSNRLAFRYRLFLPPSFFRDVAHQIADADVVHIHELRSFLGVAAVTAARRRGAPVVLSPHGGLRHLGKPLLKTIFDRFWGRRILETAAAVIAISPVEERDAVALQVKSDRIFQVPNAAPLVPLDAIPSPGVFRRKQGLGAEKLILFLGRIHPVKGADLLLEAFGQLCSEGHAGDALLVLAGPDDGQEPALRRRVRSLGLEKRVRFTGYLDQGEKLEAFVDSHLIVAPSRSEVFALTAIEALMCRRPVLLSSACGLHPAPGPQHGVRWFTEGSIEDLKEKLHSALNDSDLFSAAAAGREFVAREFSPAAIGARLEDVYRAIL